MSSTNNENSIFTGPTNGGTRTTTVVQTFLNSEKTKVTEVTSTRKFSATSEHRSLATTHSVVRVPTVDEVAAGNTRVESFVDTASETHDEEKSDEPVVGNYGQFTVVDGDGNPIINVKAGDGVDDVQDPAYYIGNKAWKSMRHTTSSFDPDGGAGKFTTVTKTYSKSQTQLDDTIIAALVPVRIDTFVYSGNILADSVRVSFTSNIGDVVTTYPADDPSNWPIRDMRMETDKYVKVYVHEAWVNPVDDVSIMGKATAYRNVLVVECRDSTETIPHSRVIYDAQFRDFRNGNFLIEDMEESASTLKDVTTTTVNETTGLKQIVSVRKNYLPGKPVNITYKFVYDSSGFATVSYKFDGVFYVDKDNNETKDQFNTNNDFTVITESDTEIYPSFEYEMPEAGQNGNVTTTSSYFEPEYTKSISQILLNNQDNTEFDYSSISQGKIRSMTVVKVTTPDDSMKIKIMYSATEENYEDIYLSFSDQTSIEYLETLVGNIQSTVGCSIYDLEAINLAIGGEESVSSLSIEMKEDDSIIKFRELNDNYSSMIVVYQQMTADIGATMTISDKVLREAWMKEFKRFTQNIRIMRSLVLDLTAVYKLENKLTVSFWAKLESVMTKATDTVSMDIDKLLNYGSESCNQEVVDGVVKQVTKLQTAFKGMAGLAENGNHTLGNIMGMIPDGTNVSEINEICGLNTKIASKVGSLNERLARLTRVMSAKVTVGGKAKMNGSAFEVDQYGNRVWDTKTANNKFNTGSSI